MPFGYRLHHAADRSFEIVGQLVHQGATLFHDLALAFGFGFGFAFDFGFDFSGSFVGFGGDFFGTGFDGFAGRVEVFGGVFGGFVSGGRGGVFGLLRASGERESGAGGGDENELTHNDIPCSLWTSIEGQPPMGGRADRAAASRS